MFGQKDERNHNKYKNFQGVQYCKQHKIQKNTQYFLLVI